MNSASPLVSVIIPTYNRAGIICETIDNVFQQTYTNIEVIVIDDGSKDDTLARLRSYGDRIRVISQANAGPAPARNRGIEASRGEIITFQDSDDLWKPTKLERQVNLLARTDASVPCCLCSAAMRVVNGKEFSSFDAAAIRFHEDEGLWLNVAEVLATRFVLFNQTVAIRRWAIEKTGMFDEGLKYLEDYDLPLRLAMEGPWAFIREPLVIYREATEGSFSKQAAKDPVVLKECEITIFERPLERAKGEKNSKGRRQLQARLGIFRRRLRATKLSSVDSPVSRAVGRIATGMESYREAPMRRSPWYPQPVTSRIDIGAAWPSELEPVVQAK